MQRSITGIGLGAKTLFQTGHHQGIISGTPISDKSRLFFGTAEGRTKKSGAKAPLYHNFYLLRLFILTGIVQARPSLRNYTGSVSRHAFGQGNGFRHRGILLWEKHLTPGHRPKAVYRCGRPTALYPGSVLSHRRAGSLHRRPRQPPSYRSRYFSQLPL